MQSCVIDPNSRRVNLDISVLHEQTPVVSQLNNLIQPDEAEYLIQKAESLGMKRSTVAAPNGGAVHESRTSSTAFLPKGNDPVISCIEHKISAAAGIPHKNLEPLQVTRYRHKEKYDSHYDWFADKKPGEGQRTKTVFTYLKGLENEGGQSCGGATAFPNIRDANNEVVRAYPISGNAVMWSNVTNTGDGEKNSLHGGEKVLCEGETKIGLNAWFRDKPW
jgi:hypothetical protein